MNKQKGLFQWDPLPALELHFWVFQIRGCFRYLDDGRLNPRSFNSNYSISISIVCVFFLEQQCVQYISSSLPLISPLLQLFDKYRSNFYFNELFFVPILNSFEARNSLCRIGPQQNTTDGLSYLNVILQDIIADT